MGKGIDSEGIALWGAGEGGRHGQPRRKYWQLVAGRQDGQPLHRQRPALSVRSGTHTTIVASSAFRSACRQERDAPSFFLPARAPSEVHGAKLGGDDDSRRGSMTAHNDNYSSDGEGEGTGDEGSFVTGSSTPADMSNASASSSRKHSRTPHFTLTPMTEYRSSTSYPYDEVEVTGDASGPWSEDDEASPPGSTTPSFNESYSHLKKTLSFKGLRELELKHVQKAAWRRKGEPRKRPRDLEQLLIYALSGSTRAFTLAYLLRTGVNVLTVLIRSLQRGRVKANTLLRVLTDPSGIRFGGMFGAYVFIWKMVIHLLRLYNPGKKGWKRVEFWHAPVAGALSGLAVLAETKNSRIGIAQQLFVR